ncbi:MAG: hypothetical protein FD176_197 [Rhodospirillaceae bacterium]|nr:MAG: hypothetical protein FD176_197 [Rhodospirillaceae bacterium]TNC98715.1 MAG: hypothetical protein FD119_186 [Stygiobacter sp.]
MWDYDDIDRWGPKLQDHLASMFPTDVKYTLAEAAPEFVEDACDLLLDQLLVPRETFASILVDWIAGQAVAAYHGTRLIENEVTDVRRNGLRRLVAADREPRLRRALSRHPRWSEVEGQLTGAIDHVGPGNGCGRREGQVHATLSRAGLVDGFNHYIGHGSEFDQHVAQHLLGQDGLEMLAVDGDQYMIKLAVPGAVALRANNPFGFDHEDFQDMIRHLLQAWAFKLAFPQWQCASMQIDSGLVFHNDVPAEWIVEITRL